MNGDTRRIVVVGAGLGGLRTVEALRRAEFAGPITLIGGEQHAPYDRPPLTKQVLRGEIDSTALRGELESLDIDLRLGVRAAALDTERKLVTLTDGTEVGYDVAVLAPGAAPRTLPGIPLRPGMHVVRTLDDALALRTAIARAGAVTVIGGGFIGCEVAASARTLGADVDLVEILAAPLIRILGPTGAAIVTDLHRGHGVRLRTGVGVTEVLGTDHVEGVTLTDGTILTAPEVVLGLGVSPDTDWLTGSGVTVGDGIECTAAGRTSVPQVYALGDAARWSHSLDAEHRRVEHWTTTTDQARIVAANIVRGDDDPESELHDVPYFWSDQYDVKIQALGFLDADDDVELLEPAEGRRLLLYSRNDTLRAVVGFNATKWVMRTRALIAAHATLDQARAAI